MRPGLATVVLLCVVVTGYATSAWVGGGLDGGTASGGCSCGGVAGTYGAIVSFGSAGGDDASTQTSHGTIGATWAGVQVPETACDPPLIEDKHSHVWVKQGSGNTSNNTLRAESATTAMTSGGCEPRHTSPPDPPQWWWRPTVSATLKLPKIQKLNTTTSNWDDQNWTNSFGDSANGSYSAQQITGEESSPCAPTYVKLDRRTVFSMPASAAAGTLYRVMWELLTDVAATVDNAKVTGWTQGMHVDLASEISDASTTEDFSLLVPD